MLITVPFHNRNRQIRGAFQQFSVRWTARSCAPFIRSERLFLTMIHSAAHSCGQAVYGVLRAAAGAAAHLLRSCPATLVHGPAARLDVLAGLGHDGLVHGRLGLFE